VITVEELMDRLSEMPPEAEVRIAEQPQWAFEYSIESFNPVVVARDGDNNEVVYIGEGSQLGYLPGSVAEELGW
jgi:hypothetical protein